jgi:hypothetical protein
LAKTEVSQVRPDVFRELWGRFVAEFVQRTSDPFHFLARACDLLIEAFQLRVSPFDFPHPLRRAFAKGNYFGNRAAVLALQCFKERDPLLQRRELCRIQVQLLCVLPERSGNFGELDDRSRMRFRQHRF